MKAKGFLASIAVLAVAAFVYAQSFDIQYPQGVRYVASVNTAAEVLSNFGAGQFPGQLVVAINNSQDTALYMWNQNDDVWEMIAGDTLTLDGPLTVTGATTQTGNVTHSGTLTVVGVADFQSSFGVGAADFTEAELETLDGVTAGTLAASKVVVVDSSSRIDVMNIVNPTLGLNESDTVSIVSAVSRVLYREDFDQVVFLPHETDGTVAVQTDASVNYLTLMSSDGDNIPLIGYRIEAPDGAALADTLTPGTVDGVFTTDGFVDAVADEGIVFTFGAQDSASNTFGHGIVYNETSSASTYCETTIDVANISAIDDMWFGWVLNDATDNPPASASYNTMAVFRIIDNLGDLDVATELNDVTTPEVNDIGTDWVDGDQFILRVQMLADTVVFTGCFTDACITRGSISHATAVLNADDGDIFQCVLGFTIVAAESPGITLDYVEIGLE